MKKILLVVGVALLAGAGFVAYTTLQPETVPMGKGLNMAQSSPTENGQFQVSIAPQDPAFHRNDLHAWIATVTTPEGQPVKGAGITIDGGMPMHGHGLPTNPEMTRYLGQGQYLIDGVRFNMPGMWEFKLAITAGDVTDNVTFNLRFNQ